MASLFDVARACLDATSPDDKVALTAAAAVAYTRGDLRMPADAPAPEPIAMPGRPTRPGLVHPWELSKRGLGSTQGRAAFIHSIAHIELNAIDLAWDAIYRFRGLPADYYADWLAVAADEARHFTMLRTRLRVFGHDYGDFDAHNGLWEMAEKTAHDGLARMALVPRVLEARGLDVTPAMITKLRVLGDDVTADILATILREEIAHVASGSRWFRWHCEQVGAEPRARFRELLDEYAHGSLRGPFNHDARLAAGFELDEIAYLEQLG